MPIEGPLRELGIHDVFQLLDLSRKTGALRVTSELRHNEGTIYFDNGVVVSAEIRSNPHPLGALLLRTGKITEADLERARDMQQRQGDRRRLGEILVALGVITKREVERQVRFQIEEVVFEVMSWNEGYFSFAEQGESKVPTELTVRIPVEALLMEGARRIDEWSRMEKRIPHVGVVALVAPPPAGCSCTTRPCTCCSAGSTWRRATPQRQPRSSAARCDSIRCWPRRTASSDSRSSPWAALRKRSPAGTSGSGSPAPPTKKRNGRTCNARARRPGCSAMADEIRALSAQLAPDPQSLVFLRLREG